MLDVEKLKKSISHNGYTINSISKELTIHPSTFYRKLEQSDGRFTINEVLQLVKLLKLNTKQVNEIFLVEQSHKRELT